jgi:tetratricopeptide (TPR) repeat protein
MALGRLGDLHREAGRFEEARAALDSGEALLRDVGDPKALAGLLWQRAQLEHAEQHPDEALAALEEAAALVEQVGAEPESELGVTLAKTRALLEGA